MKEIIAKKKAGKKLSEAEINRVVAGVTSGEIPDYQITALLMAICFQGMDVQERAWLTRAMAASETSSQLNPGSRRENPATEPQIVSRLDARRSSDAFPVARHRLL